MNEDEQQHIQQKYLELQIANQQIKQLRQHIQQFEEQLSELLLLDQGIDSLSETKIGTEMLVPLSSGIFVKVELKDNKILAVNVGSGTVVKKSISDTKGLIKKQIE